MSSIKRTRGHETDGFFACSTTPVGGLPAPKISELDGYSWSDDIIGNLPQVGLDDYVPPFPTDFCDGLSESSGRCMNPLAAHDGRSVSPGPPPIDASMTLDELFAAFAHDTDPTACHKLSAPNALGNALSKPDATVASTHCSQVVKLVYALPSAPQNLLATSNSTAPTGYLHLSLDEHRTLLSTALRPELILPDEVLLALSAADDPSRLYDRIAAVAQGSQATAIYKTGLSLPFLRSTDAPAAQGSWHHRAKVSRKKMSGLITAVEEFNPHKFRSFPAHHACDLMTIFHRCSHYLQCRFSQYHPAIIGLSERTYMGSSMKSDFIVHQRNVAVEVQTHLLAVFLPKISLDVLNRIYELFP